MMKVKEDKKKVLMVIECVLFIVGTVVCCFIVALVFQGATLLFTRHLLMSWNDFNALILAVLIVSSVTFPVSSYMDWVDNYGENDY